MAVYLSKMAATMVGTISTDASLRASFDIPTRDNIHRYQCNNPILSPLYAANCDKVLFLTPNSQPCRL